MTAPETTDELDRARRIADRLGVSAVRRIDEGGRSTTPERWGWYSIEYPDSGMDGAFATELEALREGIEIAADGRAYCARCGCTEDDPCEGGCYWTDAGEETMDDICSACVSPFVPEEAEA